MSCDPATRGKPRHRGPTEGTQPRPPRSPALGTPERDCVVPAPARTSLWEPLRDPVSTITAASDKAAMMRSRSSMRSRLGRTPGAYSLTNTRCAMTSNNQE